MKKVIYLLLIAISCKQNNKINIAGKVEQFNHRGANNLNGIWFLNDYFDSIKQRKAVAKYRIQPPSWFGIVVEIKNDSLYSFGSIVAEKRKLDNYYDTILKFESFGKWSLIKNDRLLKLISRTDKKEFTYCKKKNLEYLVKDLPYRKFGKSITEYFNKEILCGDYINTLTNEKITFKENGKLVGFKGYDSYEIRNYFGTLHPHNNLDVVTLFNTTNGKRKELNWIFKKNKLILSEFKVEIVNRFGKKTPTDNYVLGKRIMELKNN